MSVRGRGTLPATPPSRYRRGTSLSRKIVDNQQNKECQSSPVEMPSKQSYVFTQNYYDNSSVEIIEESCSPQITLPIPTEILNTKSAILNRSDDDEEKATGISPDGR